MTTKNGATRNKVARVKVYIDRRPEIEATIDEEVTFIVPLPGEITEGCIDSNDNLIKREIQNIGKMKILTTDEIEESKRNVQTYQRKKEFREEDIDLMNDESKTKKKLKDSQHNDTLSDYFVEQNERAKHKRYAYVVNSDKLKEVILRLLRKYESANSTSSYANLVYEEINEPWKVDLTKVRTREEYSETFVTLLVECGDQRDQFVNKKLEKIDDTERFIFTAETDEVHVKPRYIYLPVIVNFVPSFSSLLKDKIAFTDSKEPPSDTDILVSKTQKSTILVKCDATARILPDAVYYNETAVAYETNETIWRDHGIRYVNWIDGTTTKRKTPAENLVEILCRELCLYNWWDFDIKVNFLRSTIHGSLTQSVPSSTRDEIGERNFKGWNKWMSSARCFHKKLLMDIPWTLVRSIELQKRFKTEERNFSMATIFDSKNVNSFDTEKSFVLNACFDLQKAIECIDDIERAVRVEEIWQNRRINTILQWTNDETYTLYTGILKRQFTSLKNVENFDAFTFRQIIRDIVSSNMNLLRRRGQLMTRNLQNGQKRVMRKENADDNVNDENNSAAYDARQDRAIKESLEECQQFLHSSGLTALEIIFPIAVRATACLKSNNVNPPFEKHLGIIVAHRILLLVPLRRQRQKDDATESTVTLRRRKEEITRRDGNLKENREIRTQGGENAKPDYEGENDRRQKSWNNFFDRKKSEKKQQNEIFTNILDKINSNRAKSDGDASNVRSNNTNVHDATMGNRVNREYLNEVKGIAKRSDTKITKQKDEKKSRGKNDTTSSPLRERGENNREDTTANYTLCMSREIRIVRFDGSEEKVAVKTVERTRRNSHEKNISSSDDSDINGNANSKTAKTSLFWRRGKTNETRKKEAISDANYRSKSYDENYSYISVDFSTERPSEHNNYGIDDTKRVTELMIVDTKCNLSTSLRSWKETGCETVDLETNDTLGSLFDAINCTTQPRNANRVVMGELCIRSENNEKQHKKQHKKQHEFEFLEGKNEKRREVSKKMNSKSLLPPPLPPKPGQNGRKQKSGRLNEMKDLINKNKQAEKCTNFRVNGVKSNTIKQVGQACNKNQINFLPLKEIRQLLRKVLERREINEKVFLRESKGTLDALVYIQNYYTMTNDYQEEEKVKRVKTIRRKLMQKYNAMLRFRTMGNKLCKKIEKTCRKLMQHLMDKSNSSDSEWDTMIDKTKNENGRLLERVTQAVENLLKLEDVNGIGNSADRNKELANVQTNKSNE